MGIERRYKEYGLVCGDMRKERLQAVKHEFLSYLLCIEKVTWSYQ